MVKRDKKRRRQGQGCINNSVTYCEKLQKYTFHIYTLTYEISLIFFRHV